MSSKRSGLPPIVFVASAVQPVRFVDASTATSWLDSALMLNPNRFEVISKWLKNGVQNCWTSNAPMPLASLPGAFEFWGRSKSRGRPRWSVVEALKFEPLSMAGLPHSSACVKAGPPLFRNGPGSGSVLI